MRAAVLGSPVGHSLSPALHRAAYAELGLDGWSYEAIECDEARLAGLLGSLDDSWAGLSLTMPLKRAVIALLDAVTPLASRVGAVNTVVFRGGGDVAGDGLAGSGGDGTPRDRVMHGYNTDVGGIVDALAACGAAVPASALIIGGGATACSALAAMRDIGLRNVTVAVRSTARAGDLLAAAGRLGISVHLTGVESVGDPGGARGELVISTVPSGAADQLTGRFGTLTPAAMLDVVYDPWPTKLAAAAQEAGATIIGGFDLLLYQAARQVRLMTGLEPPVQVMRTAGLAVLAQRPAG